MRKKNLSLCIISLFIIQCNKPVEIDNTVYSLDGKKLEAAELSPATKLKLENNLKTAEKKYSTDPEKLDNIIWLGRRIAYLSRYNEAIDIFTKGIKKFPDSPELYRHRGHRYISVRKFDEAISDFEKAAELSKGMSVKIEPDGQPNKLSIPLSSLQFNIWYHLGLAHYLKRDFEKALAAYFRCMEYSTNNDLLIATADWLYMTFKRLGKDEEAEELLEKITEGMEIIENDAYYQRLLMYKGLKSTNDLIDLNNTDPDKLIEIVTQGYGVGNWYFNKGDIDKAKEIFHKVIKTGSWSAFGYIAAEADLYYMNK
ncbi:tetratricopeptide repeat protein [Bacteroidota bacterium]